MPFTQAHQFAGILLGVIPCRSTLVRLSQFYGDRIEADLNQPDTPADTPAAPGIVYGMADGLMVHIDGAWREVKLGRTFSQNDRQSSPVEDRAGQINRSLYLAQVGHCDQFWQPWQTHLAPFEPLGENLVLVSDGVPWLAQGQQRDFGQATAILDYYHAVEHLASVGRAAMGQGKSYLNWLEKQANHLLSSELDSVLADLALLKKGCSERDKAVDYFTLNRYRMDYKTYRERGLCIGSGAIESANGAVVQHRLKRPGQRWGKVGAQRILNLRCCWMSDRWHLIEGCLQPASYAMAE